MDKKDSFIVRTGNFLAGKGFYIVLFLCVAVIGASAWAMIRIGNDDSDDLDMEMTATDESTEPTEGITEEDEPAMAETVTEATEEPSGDEETNAEEPAEEPVYVPKTFVNPVSGEILVYHSMTELIYDKTLGDWRTHAGIDIAADLGAQVVAISSGTVESVYTDDLQGTVVVINHGDELRSIYANLAVTPTVAEGDSVVTGDVIGAVGDSAIVETGLVSHLHLEVTLNSEQVDPLDYLPEG